MTDDVFAATRPTPGGRRRRGARRPGRLGLVAAAVALVGGLIAIDSATAAPTNQRAENVIAQYPNDASSVTMAAASSSLQAKGRVGGWYAGAAGYGVADGRFQAWLGQPLGIVGTWADRSALEQREVSGLYGLENWRGAMDIATGGLAPGETYARAAAGAYDGRWRAALTRIASVRKGKGPTFIRPFHEFNGTWTVWSINRANLADYKKSWVRYARMVRQVMPTAYIVWSPNYGDHTGIGVNSYYPGNAYVDVIGPDFYSDLDSTNRVVTGYRAWIAKQSTWRNGSPLGIEAWRAWAKRRGKPIALPEWGLKPGPFGSDLPGWISSVHTWARIHQNTTSWPLGKPMKGAGGKVLYTIYFNTTYDGPANTVYGYGANPQAAARFRSLRWGTPR